MVTAGVYLLMRSSPLIEYSSTVLIICLWLGAITTVFSSLIGLFQQDIKKVIAYSTMSQLAQEYINMFRHQTICVEVLNYFYTIYTNYFFKKDDFIYTKPKHCVYNSNKVKKKSYSFNQKRTFSTTNILQVEPPKVVWVKSINERIQDLDEECTSDEEELGLIKERVRSI